MVQLMSSSKRVAAKLELEEALEDELSPLHTKRSKFDLSNFQESNIENGKFPFQLEPSPLGLNLKKSPSFLDLIQMKLSEQNATNLSSLKKKDGKASTVPSIHDKLKASNFPASLLRIGSWEYKSRYEGDLVAKCYYAKHKLVWEVLDGGLKNKIEFQWSDIIAIKGNYPDDRPGTVELVLARQPLFFRETNPQPRKHTLWQTTSDFTDGQASLHRQHFLQCPPGLLGKHFEKLIQCDPRLNCLSKQAEISLESPYFEPRISGFGDSNEADHAVELKSEERPSIFGLQDPLSTSAGQSSSCNNEQDSGCRAAENFFRRAPPPSSVEDTRGIDKIGSCMVKERKLLKQWDQIRVPGIHASMSMSDLVNHIGNCISEQMTYSGDDMPNRDILEEITQYLLNDSQHASAPDEQCLMSRVNSLCCLLQKDSGITSDFQTKEASNIDVHGRGKNVEGSSVSVSARDSKSPEGFPLLTVESDDVPESYRLRAMSRKDSVGDFLLNLPRIASLPKFLFDIMEDSGIEAIKTNGPKAFSATRTDK